MGKKSGFVDLGFVKTFDKLEQELRWLETPSSDFNQMKGCKNP